MVITTNLSEVTVSRGVVQDDMPSSIPYAGIAPTVCSATSGGNGVPVTVSTYSNGTLNVTVAGAMPPGVEVGLSCSCVGVQTDYNLELGTVLFGVHTTANPTALTVILLARQSLDRARGSYTGM